MTSRVHLRFRALSCFWIWIALLAGWGSPHLARVCWAQMIGTTPNTSTPAGEEGDKTLQFLTRLGERLTSQELNMKKISCDEQVAVERSREKGQPASVRNQKFIVKAEIKQHGEFSIDTSLVEEHSPVESGDPSAHPGDREQAVDASFLVRDSLSAAPEFLGLSHREIYSQRFLGKEPLDGREAFTVAFQTVKQLESRRITLAGRSVPMRIAGRVWLDAATGMLLRLEVQQTKLPKGIREFSYDVRYALAPAQSAAPILPATVHFRRVQDGETLVTTQTFSNCRVN
ncbi:MAG: hypothetical protein LAO21_02740 [Acidobacteriia bacterium]|nr:hypothetical protein [Terriglobia bacterium]